MNRWTSPGRSFIDHGNVFALVLKESGRVIGSLGLHESWANEESAYARLKIKEIGYVLSKEYWGRGLVPEAVREVIRYGFEECGVEAFTVGHFASNTQSKRVIEKCGFSFVRKGIYRAKQLDREFEDAKYILLKSAWEGA